MKKEPKMFCAPRKKIYIAGVISSIIVSLFISYLFSDFLIEVKNISKSSLFAILVPILVITILTSFFAVIVVCNDNKRQSLK